MEKNPTSAYLLVGNWTSDAAQWGVKCCYWPSLCRQLRLPRLELRLSEHAEAGDCEHADEHPLTQLETLDWELDGGGRGIQPDPLLGLVVPQVGREDYVQDFCV